MAHRIHVSFLIACLTSALFPFAAAALDGRVIDKATGQALSDVFVIARWEGETANPVHSKSVCYHAEITTTTTDGKFRIPELSGNLDPFIVHRYRSISYYKPGYRVTTSDDEPLQIMERRKDPQSFEDVARFSKPPYGCGGDSKTFLPILKASISELEPLARTTEDRRLMRDRLYNAESIELGEEVARKNLNRRELDAQGGQNK
jgi:hypothetical protein